MNMEDCFWANVAKTNGCWNWTAARDLHGYGALRVAGRVVGAHRHSYALANGPIPPGHHVLHHCDNPACVRPDHLFLGSRAENMGDMVRKGRQAKGERNGQAKLTAEQVGEIRSSDLPQFRLADIYGVSNQQISLIKSGKRWKEAAPCMTT